MKTYSSPKERVKQHVTMAEQFLQRQETKFSLDWQNIEPKFMLIFSVYISQDGVSSSEQSDIN